MRTYAILPYRELIDIAEETIHQYDIQLQVVEGHVEEAIPAALSAEKDGAEIIISRGGTAEIIQRHVHVPVVKIRVSDLDLLRILYPLKGLDRKILVVGFKNAVYRARAVARVLGLNVQILPVPYESEDYDFDTVKYAAERLIRTYGVDTIVGDQTAYVNLRSFCECQYLITSGKDDFIEAVESTTISSRLPRKSQPDFSRVRQVFDAVQDAILSTDEDGIITIFNKPAGKLFQSDEETAIGTHISSLLRTDSPFGTIPASLKNVLATSSPRYEYVQNLRGSLFAVYTNPLQVDQRPRGAVVTIREISDTNSEKPKREKRIETSRSRGFKTKYTFENILTHDSELIKKINIARGYARTDATILIEGESGVGKELFAQSIHSGSPRCSEPFVAVNCAAIPAQLLESELFGYENGAFTGAGKNGKKGLFELANHGTIFLDEISEIESSLQVRFLRVLEEQQLMRVGSEKLVDIDVRIIAATNRNLKDQIFEGKFRKDLYYRLNLLNLQIPPLREHRIDIPYLASHFFRLSCAKYECRKIELPDPVIQLLKQYDWPGNIRELRNVMERAALTIGTGCIGMPDISLITEEIRRTVAQQADSPLVPRLEGTMDEIKHNAALAALRQENYNKSRAARRLGIDRSTLDRLLA